MKHFFELMKTSFKNLKMPEAGPVLNLRVYLKRPKSKGIQFEA